MDPQNYVKWQAILAMFVGAIGTAFGIALLIADRFVAEGACLTIIGIAVLLSRIWGVRRSK
jgi:hypothetical protein